MAIVIPREGNMYTEIPPLTQEQRDKLWECIVRNWAKNNPDALKPERCTAYDPERT